MQESGLDVMLTFNRREVRKSRVYLICLLVSVRSIVVVGSLRVQAGIKGRAVCSQKWRCCITQSKINTECWQQ